MWDFSVHWKADRSQLSLTQNIEIKSQITKKLKQKPLNQIKPLNSQLCLTCIVRCGEVIVGAYVLQLRARGFHFWPFQ